MDVATFSSFSRSPDDYKKKIQKLKLCINLVPWHIQMTGTQYGANIEANVSPWGGGGGVLGISSDRDDRMGAKIKTQKYPWTKN